MTSKEGVSAIKDGCIKHLTIKTKRVASSSLYGASKKQKLMDSAYVEPVKELKYLVDPDQPFSANVNFNFQANAPALLKEYVDETQIFMFRGTCFSRFLDMEL